MITLYKNNYADPDFQIEYKKLFEKARNALLVQYPDLEPFTGLDDYFAYIGDLIQLDPLYAMIPLDEAPFKINANTRSIEVPSAFVKCAGVQNDNLCEIITFIIDRYFDYVDLDTTTIAVQWQSANKKGIHIVELKDIETYPGKIRFGWPLNSDITETPGDIIFSIRFFIRPEIGGEMKYILNTLPAKISIKSTLNVTGVEEERGIPNLFKTFVQNSMNPSGERPIRPWFPEGWNLQLDGALVDDQLDLQAQALNSDNGLISYQWFYQSNPNDPPIEIKEDNTAYIINNSHLVEVNDWNRDSEDNIIRVRKPGRKYYFENGQECIDREFTDSTPTLYYRYALLKIVPGDAIITGNYWVQANNTVSNNTISELSNRCEIPAPSAIETLAEDLQDFVFIDGPNKVSSLNFKLEKDKNDRAHPSYAFKWMREGAEDPVKTEDPTSNHFTTLPLNEDSEIGVYYVDYKVALNRTEYVNTIPCNKCRVLKMPVAPAADEMRLLVNNRDILDNDINNEVTSYPSSGANAVLRVELTDEAKAKFENNNLMSDKLTYVWKVNYPDSEGYVNLDIAGGITSGEIVAYNENTPNEITISVGKRIGQGQTIAYSCEIINELAGKRAVIDTADIEPFIITWKIEEPSVEETEPEEV